MKNISPFTDSPILSREQIMEWVELSKKAMAARKWSDPKCTPE